MTDEEVRIKLEAHYQLIRDSIDEIDWETFDISWLNESMLRELRDYVTVTSMVKYGNMLGMDFVRELLPSLSLHDIMIIQDRIDALDDKFYSKKATMNRDEIVSEYMISGTICVFIECINGLERKVSISTL